MIFLTKRKVDLLLFLSLTGFLMVIYGCDKENHPQDQIVDSRDGNVYRIVSIGKQVWMAENLKYLPAVTGPEEGSRTSPHYYVYGYDGTNVNEAKTTENYRTYGVLYNWSAAMNSCPTGWHLPSYEEWEDLIYFLGGIEVAGDKLKEKGHIHWNRLPKTEATNETGFTALPGGHRSQGSEFLYMGDYTGWWSTREGNDVHEEGENYPSWFISVDSWTPRVYIFPLFKDFGNSVRCLRN